MELDDLKDAWKQTTLRKNKNTDIMELIQHKSYGPVSALKRTFRKEIIVMILMPFFLLITSLDDISKPLSSVMYWSYVAFCSFMIYSAWRNYQLISKLEGMDGIVVSNLEKQITILELRLRRNIVSLRITMLFFIGLTELLPYFQHFRMLDKWHSLSPWIRIGVYSAFVLLQYFIGRQVMYRKYGRHLEYLKSLVNEMS
jgi:hypothetical protein